MSKLQTVPATAAPTPTPTAAAASTANLQLAKIFQNPPDRIVEISRVSGLEEEGAKGRRHPQFDLRH